MRTRTIRFALTLALGAALAACGGGDDGVCTPLPYMQLYYKDARDGDSDTSDHRWFGTLEAVRFNPRYVEICGASTSFSVVSGSLPPGVFLDRSSGVIAGVPTDWGTYRPVIAMRMRGYSGEATWDLDFTVDDFGISYAHGAVWGRVGSPLSVMPTIHDGDLWSGALHSNGQRGFILPAGAVVSYALASGSLPPGVTLDPATGAIAGTPTLAGTFSVQIRAVASKDGAAVPSGRNSSLSFFIE